MSETTRQVAYDFRDRIAIVTGAGSGIGREMALGFARAGGTVLVNDIIAERAEETAGLVTAAGGNAAVAVADISDEAAVEGFVRDAMTRWGQIDYLCNNAGIMDKINLPADVTSELWNRVMEVNATGYFLVTRAVLPHMVARKEGSIINTASAAGTRGGAAGTVYAASKHAVVGLTRSIAWMHRNDGIRCNAICPGAIETNITGPLGFKAFDPAGLERMMPVMALARAAKPYVIADLALFLASESASFINGAIIPVDGGWSAG